MQLRIKSLQKDFLFYFLFSIVLAACLYTGITKHTIITNNITAIYSTNNQIIKNNFNGMPASATKDVHQNKKLIALSFDDGPNGKYTEAVLSILKANNAKATFFVCGDSTQAQPNLVKKEYDAGNEIGNHTYSHANISKLSKSALTKELTKANDEIHKAINVYPVLFRPPYGASSDSANQTISQLGFKKITWNFMVNDFDIKKTNANKIASEVIAHAHPGAIIDMHDGGGNREKTVAALPVILAALKKQGYEFVTVSTIVKVAPYRNR